MIFLYPPSAPSSALLLRGGVFSLLGLTIIRADLNGRTVALDIGLGRFSRVPQRIVPLPQLPHYSPEVAVVRGIVVVLAVEVGLEAAVEPPPAAVRGSAGAAARGGVVVAVDRRKL